MDNEQWQGQQEQAFLNEPANLDVNCSYDGCFKHAETADASGETVCSEHLMSE